MSKTLFGRYVQLIMSLWIIICGSSIALAGSPSWKDVGRACLPEQGRMLKSQTAACHCPPDSYCPKNISEWSTNPRQPGFISSICCERPKTCDLNFTRQGGCGTGSFSKQTQNLCLENLYDESLAVDQIHLKNMLDLQDGVNQCLAQKREALATLLTTSSTNQAAWSNWMRDYNTCVAPLRGKKGFSCTDKVSVNVCTTVVARNCGTSGDCVAADSRVTLSNGAKKSISDIQVGDVVKGLTSDNVVLSVSRIEKVNSILSQINGEGGLMISAGHPMLTVDGWKAISPDYVQISDVSSSLTIGTLEVGDTLIGDGNYEEVVKSITVPENGMQKLYNIAVDGDNTFIVNDIVIRGYNNSIKY